MAIPSKQELLRSVKTELQAELVHLEQATKAALSAATDDESRPENQYDTRALEASYLAAAQGKRVLELKRMLAMLEAFPATESRGPASSGSLVEAESEGKQSWYFLLPFGAGVSASSSGQKVAVVTLDSPLGRALAGKRVGEVAELPRPGGPKEFEILSIN